MNSFCSQKFQSNSHQSESSFTGFAIAFFAFIFLFQFAATGAALARSISPLPQSLANITNFRGDNGNIYYFYATGSTSGSIWGSDIYTDDSDLATAAVHAGVLSAGQTGIVKVTILAGQSSYLATTANGVVSGSYGQWDGSYSVAADDGGDNPVLDAPSNLQNFREVPGGVYHFNVQGDNSGSVWGTNVYSDDSNLATAAVHAGVLVLNQTGTVKVTIVPGQLSYIGCESNGVTSISYGEWGGSFTVSDISGSVGLIPYPGTMENPYSNPGNLTGYRGLNGAAFYFEITGSTVGSVWGTNVYTDDSGLATAAVHAGVLSAGQTGVVKVTILAGQSGYLATTANGVNSQSYGKWDGSYSVAEPDGSAGALPVVTNATASGQVEKYFTYQINATNSPTSYNVTGLPVGLTFNAASGLISGTPELTGSFVINMLAINAVGTGAGELVLTVTSESTGVTFLTVTPSTSIVSVGKTDTLSISGGKNPYSVTSDDTSVATVSLIGNTATVTGVAEGTATITITDSASNNVNVDIVVKETTSGECATFDLFANTLHVPCLDLGGSYWLDLQMMSGDPITFQLTDYGENLTGGTIGECATFDLFANTLHVPCLDLGGSYWLDLQMMSGDPITFQLTDYGEN